jgi:serine/threonine protein kinase
MPNGTLDRHLFGDHLKASRLTWPVRHWILRDVASALLYLHEGWESVVLHRDVKASNVLLNADMSARLGDFGLAKLHERGANLSTTRVVAFPFVSTAFHRPQLRPSCSPRTAAVVLPPRAAAGPSSSWEEREEVRWLREEQRWLRKESRWRAKREALLAEVAALWLCLCALEDVGITGAGSGDVAPGKW